MYIFFHYDTFLWFLLKEFFAGSYSNDSKINTRIIKRVLKFAKRYTCINNIQITNVLQCYWCVLQCYWWAGTTGTAHISDRCQLHPIDLHYLKTALKSLKFVNNKLLVSVIYLFFCVSCCYTSFNFYSSFTNYVIINFDHFCMLNIRCRYTM